MLAALPPFVARGLGTGLGAFSMFTRIERYHLELFSRRSADANSEERVLVGTLAPHLSPDAQQVILPAAGYGFGQEQVEELSRGLPDLGRLLCELRPDAESSRVALSRGLVREHVMTTLEVQVPCRHLSPGSPLR